MHISDNLTSVNIAAEAVLVRVDETGFTTHTLLLKRRFSLERTSDTRRTEKHQENADFPLDADNLGQPSLNRLDHSFGTLLL